MRLQQSLLYLAVVLSTTACQSPLPEAPASPKYWAEVYSRYLQSDQAYKTELTIRSGDSIHTALPTRITGTILADGRALQFRQLPDILMRYQLDYTSDFSPELVYTFQTTDFERQQLALNFKPLPAFQVAAQQISQNEGGQLYLSESLLLTADEELIIMISDVQKQTASIELSGPVQIDTLHISGSQLQALQNTGSGSVYLLSKKRGHISDKDAHWTYLLEYYTDEQVLEIVR